MTFLICHKTAERIASRPSQSTGSSDQVVTPRQPVPNNPKVRNGPCGQASADGGFHEPGTAINRWCVGADVLVNVTVVVTLAG